MWALSIFSQLLTHFKWTICQHFAIQKQELRKANANSDVKTQAQTISRLVAATEAAATLSRNRSASRRAAITSELVDGRYVARIDEVEYNVRMTDLFLGELQQN
ncbi:MAG: hypothetical protein EZS28_024010 [Streblomastix strix]|uniref:Uncharacterized protein n=1 Tax=Streblomastix strix TaxID=222440 RepID=A0A5J4VDA2_9EUKA|nr:MAG: hypothetical protein EZS28_024010 [Streblomastix strix]